MSRRGRRGRGGRRGFDDDDNGFNAWGGYMNAKKAKLEEQFLRDRGNRHLKVLGAKIQIIFYFRKRNNL